MTFDAAKANSEVLALLVSGWTTPRIVEGEAVELPVNLELPAPLSTLLSDKATGSVTLRASNPRGLELANATIDVKGVSIGIAEIERFNLVYQNLDPWILRGKTAILLPVATTKISVDEFGLKGGDFDFARGNVLFDPPERRWRRSCYLRQIRFDTNNRRRLQDAGEDRGRGDPDADLRADLADRGRRLLQVPARVVQAARGSSGSTARAFSATSRWRTCMPST